MFLPIHYKQILLSSKIHKHATVHDILDKKNKFMMEKGSRNIGQMYSF